MKLWEILRFELRYQLRNPVFWVAVAVFFLLGVLLIVVSIWGFVLKLK